VFWLEYNSLRERDRRAMRSMTQYDYAESRIVVRGLLGLPVMQPLSAARVPLGVIAEPPTTFFGIGATTYPPLVASGAVSAERLRQSCAEFDAFAAQAAQGDAGAASAPQAWLEPPPRLVHAAVSLTNHAEADVVSAYWRSSCLLR